jgi:hypothetical protein
MKISTVDLEYGSRVLILDQVFPEHMLTKMHNLCSTYYSGSNDWKPPAHFDAKSLDQKVARYVYYGTDPFYTTELPEFLKSSTATEISQKLNTEISYSMISLWVDLPGLGSMLPHVETGGSYLSQVYITNTDHPYTGTTIYRPDNEILFQLPYRDNFGWFFDKGTTVQHGRHHDVPQGISRFSLMIWFC